MNGLQRALNPLKNRLMLTVARAVVLLVNDATKLQALQVSLLADEVRDEVERFQNYGFTAVPLPGAEAVALSVAGNRDHVVVVAVDDRRYRLKGLAAGEVAVYTDEGDKVVFKRGGLIEFTASTKVKIIAPAVELTGNLQVAGSIDAGGNIASGANITAAGNVSDGGGTKSMAGMRTAYNGHHHGTSPVPDAGM